jgi:hypothetical protein
MLVHSTAPGREWWPDGTASRKRLVRLLWQGLENLLISGTLTSLHASSSGSSSSGGTGKDGSDDSSGSVTNDTTGSTEGTEDRSSITGSSTGSGAADEAGSSSAGGDSIDGLLPEFDCLSLLDPLATALPPHPAPVPYNTVLGFRCVFSKRRRRRSRRRQRGCLAESIHRDTPYGSFNLKPQMSKINPKGRRGPAGGSGGRRKQSGAHARLAAGEGGGSWFGPGSGLGLGR